MPKGIRYFIFAVGVSFLTACGGKDASQNLENLLLPLLPNDIEIQGDWTSNFNQSIAITNEAWTENGVAFVVHEFDNQLNFVYFQNPADSFYFPSKYGRTVWTEVKNNEFYYCTTVFGKDTLDEAKVDQTQADPSDPANGGCGGFTWTKMTRKQ